MASRLDEAVTHRLEGIDWEFAGYNPTKRTHHDLGNLHWYPAPVPPMLASSLIDILGDGHGIFLDPFAGGGITAFEAWVHGYRSWGIDSNLFAVLMASARLQLLQSGTESIGRALAAAYEEFDKHRQHERATDALVDARIHPDARSWFRPDVLRKIAAAKLWLENQQVAATWSPVLAIILSSLLHKPFSKVRQYHYSYIVDRSRVGDPATESVNVRKEFATRIVATFVEAALARATLVRRGLDLNKPAPTFLHGPAQRMVARTPNPIDLVVTSPPYFGVNDYVRSQYLSWLILGWKEYDSDLREEIGQRRMRRKPEALEEYIHALRAVLVQVAERMSKGSYMAVVIGESSNPTALKGRPSARLNQALADSGLQLIWSRDRTVRFRKITSTSRRTERIYVWKVP